MPPAGCAASLRRLPDETIKAMLEFGRALRTSFQDGASDILVTKVLLGTMGCVPAFDTNFKSGFGVYIWSLATRKSSLMAMKSPH